ncbi:hypothetical protein FRAHR75_1620002 [Frankia sp. Hr75.2]|nr:hypothetical protein FRAHR75_1620002 [Frankia sp. Hr75.2]
MFPHGRVTARQNRAFLHRVTRFLAQEAGIRQFLDVGTGIPTSPNLHEVAQGVASDCRVVYADNDPIVLAHARALLTGTGEGRTAYLDADLREPVKILERYLDTLPAGSYLALTHVTPDFAPDDVGRVVDVYRSQGIPATVRTRSEVERFFDGLDMVEPGVQSVHRWRPDDPSTDSPTDAEVNVYGGLARLP